MNNTPLLKNGNGHNRVLWWLISTLTGLALGLGGSTLATVQTAVRQHAEHLAALQNQSENDGRRLERIERKLDDLLQRITAAGGR
jgi:hypothetical protein